MAQRLPQPYDNIHQQEVALLTSVRTTLARLEVVSAADRTRVGDMLEHLDSLFMLVVVGEFNSGKSMLINALLQDEYLPVGILPTTDRINILRHGMLKGRRQSSEASVILTHPARLLENMNIVDTPGSNAVFRQHEQLAREFIHRSDFVFFVMAATHAFAETDRLYLELIREYGAKVVILLNQIDLLADENQIRQVEDFIREQSTALLGFKPEIIPVSAKWAVESLRLGNLPRRRKLWESSGIQQVLDFITENLNREVRLREKLLTPLRVVQTIVSRTRGEIERQRELLEQDFSVIADVESQEKTYQETIKARLDRRFDRISQVFEGMLQRGRRFIDENLQMRFLLQLRNRADFQARFEAAVVADAPTLIAAHINDIVNELLAEDRKMWEITLDALRRMLARHQDQVVGSVGGEFIGDLAVFEENIHQAERELLRYSKQGAADNLRDVQLGALVDTAVTGISGLVGGVIVLAVIDDLVKAILAFHAGSAISAVLGPAGWVVGGAATLGGSLWLLTRRLPRARQQAKKDLADQIARLKVTFQESLMTSASKEFTLFRNHVYSSLLPIQQYLLRLRNELQEVQGQLDATLTDISRLQNEIETR